MPWDRSWVRDSSSFCIFVRVWNNVMLINLNTFVSRKVVTRSGEERKWELLFNGYKVSNWDGEKSVEMDRGDICTTF